MTRRIAAAQRAFTLVELLIAIAVATVLLALAAPSLRDFMEVQRLRSINADLITDLQFARSEAVSRNRNVVFKLGQTNGVLTCYVIFTGTDSSCDCTRGAGNACTSGSDGRELRTVSVARSTNVLVNKVGALSPAYFEFDWLTGGIKGPTVGTDDVSPFNEYVIEVKSTRSGRGWLQTTINLTGRPTVCSRDRANPGVVACP